MNVDIAVRGQRDERKGMSWTCADVGLTEQCFGIFEPTADVSLFGTRLEQGISVCILMESARMRVLCMYV